MIMVSTCWITFLFLQKISWQKVVKSFIRNVFVWNNESHIDKFTTHGTYNIKGFRGNLADGLPIYNTGTIEARLTVLAADNCITQVLTLLNAGGGDSNIYVRTKQFCKLNYIVCMRNAFRILS